MTLCLRGLATTAAVLLMACAAHAAEPGMVDDEPMRAEKTHATTPEMVAEGRALAEKKCSHCHAIGTDDESTRRNAPPFRTLGQRYPVDQLAEALAEGMVTGHDEMPEVEWPPEQIEAFLDYLRTIQIK